MAQENQEIDIRGWIIRILKNWYWFVLSCALCGAFGMYKYFSTTQKYQVDAKIMIRPSESDANPQGELMNMMGFGNTKNVEDEVVIMTSRDMYLNLVSDLNLQVEYRKKCGLRWVGQYQKRDLSVVYPPMYLDSLPGGHRIYVKVRENDYVVKVKKGRFTTKKYIVTDLSKPFDTFVGTLCFEVGDSVKQGDKFIIRTMSKLGAAEAYQKALVVAPVKKESNVVSITTTTDMPRRAIDIISRQIELYNMDAVIDKNIVATSTAGFIEERLRLIESELSSVEADVEMYKEQHGIVDLKSEAGVYLQETSNFRKEAAEIETQLNLVNYIQEFVADETKQNSLIPANIGITDPALVKLIAEYNELLLQRMRMQRTATDSNPIVDQMKDQLRLMRENIMSSIQSVQNSLKISRKTIDDHFKVAKIQRNDIPSQERRYREIARQQELKEELYLFLYQKREENALTLASTAAPAKVIASPQVNPTPVSPKMKILLLICLVFGCAIPVGCMVVYSMFNTRISDDRKEFEKLLQVPFGGWLIKNHHGGHIAVKDGENSASAELFRTLRTNIRFMYPKKVTNPVILVTSSINSEGKSYVATNLAISMALLGNKVALVGLDIRKPMLATYLDLPTNGCLTSYLADEAYALEDAIVATNIKNLDVLPAGVVPPNPNELLQGERLDELFGELRKRYDCVVIDSAPVAMVSDTFQLARVSDMTVYVSRANYTTTEMINFLNQVNEQKRLPNIVSVLNGVDGHKTGYGYGYGYGYGHDTQKKKWWQRKKA